MGGTVRQREKDEVRTSQCLRCRFGEGQVGNGAKIRVYGTDLLTRLPVRRDANQIKVRVACHKAQQLPAGVPTRTGNGDPMPNR